MALLASSLRVSGYGNYNYYSNSMSYALDPSCVWIWELHLLPHPFMQPPYLHRWIYASSLNLTPPFSCGVSRRVAPQPFH